MGVGCGTLPKGGRERVQPACFQGEAGKVLSRNEELVEEKCACNCVAFLLGRHIYFQLLQGHSSCRAVKILLPDTRTHHGNVSLERYVIPNVI